MKHTISISQARRQLAKLIKQLQKDPGMTYQITLYKEVVAELKAPALLPKEGLAAKKLLELIEALPQPRSRRKARVSQNVKRYLYGTPSR